MTMPMSQAAAPSISEALREVAMLARVSCTALGATRCSQSISAEVDADKGAPKGTTKANMKRLAGADALHREFVVLQKQAQDNLKLNCTPWGGGRHLLPNVNFERWVGEHYRFNQEHEALVEKLKSQADDILRIAAHSLREVPDVDPPSREELLKAYSMSYALEPIPSGNFPNMPPAAEAWLKEQYEANVKATYHEATNAALARMIAPLSKLVERIDIYDKRDENAEKKTFFKDAILTNVQDMLDVLSTFNLMHDPQFQHFVDQLTLLKQVSPEDIKKNPELRTAVKTKAQTTIDSLKSWLGPID